MESRRRLVRENGALAAGKYGRHPTPLDRKVRPPDRINALVDSVKPSAHGAGLYGPSTEPECQKLSECNDPVLLGSDRHDHPIEASARPTMVGFPHHRCGFPSIAWHGMIVAAESPQVAGICVETPTGGLRKRRGSQGQPPSVPRWQAGEARALAGGWERPGRSCGSERPGRLPAVS